MLIRVRPKSFLWRRSPQVKLFLMSLGLDLRLRTDDRRILEQVVFPWILERNDFRRILFVGCDWYTAGYVRMFRGRELWTLDIAPAQRSYGAARHVVDAAQNVRQHFAVESFDGIILSGVFGWGLNSREDVAKAFHGFHECLRPEGLFVLGWNDIPPGRPFEPTESEGLKEFRPFVFPPLGKSIYLTANPNRHTFNFYLK